MKWNVADENEIMAAYSEGIMAKQTVTFSFTIEVDDLLLVHPPPSIFTGQAVNFQVFSGGVPPYAIPDLSAQLPLGLTIGADGILKGSTTAKGLFPVSGQASDSGT